MIASRLSITPAKRASGGDDALGGDVAPAAGQAFAEIFGQRGGDERSEVEAGDVMARPLSGREGGFREEISWGLRPQTPAVFLEEIAGEAPCREAAFDAPGVVHGSIPCVAATCARRLGSSNFTIRGYVQRRKQLPRCHLTPAHVG